MSGGGAYFVSASTPVMESCLFAGNRADQSGGGIMLNNSLATSPTRFTGCTIVNNTGGIATGGGVAIMSPIPSIMENCIIAFNGPGPGIGCAVPTAQADLACCDIYGNAGGDWVDCVASQLGIKGNFSLDPQFADTTAENYSLAADSPCAAENNTCGTIIGAREICDCSHMADCDDDGNLTPVDVVLMVDFILRNGVAPPVDPQCPAINRGDFDCSSSVNLLDLVGMINFVYRHPAPGPCNQCAM